MNEYNQTRFLDDTKKQSFTERLLWGVGVLFIASSFYIFGPITLTKVGFLIIILSFIGTFTNKIMRNLAKPTLAETYLIFLFLFSGLSIFWAKDVLASLNHYLSFASCLALLFFVRVVLHSNYFRIFILLRALIFSTVFSCLLGFAQFSTGRFFVPGIDERSILVGDTFRANGLFDDPNYFGYLLTLVWPLILIMRPERPISTYLFTGIIFFGVLTTFSRATLLIVFVQVLFLTVVSSRDITGMILKTSLLLSALLSTVFTLNPFGIADRLLSFVPVFFDSGLDTENSSAERVDLIFAGIRMFYENFLFGVGFGNFQIWSPDYMSLFPREAYAHNTYLTVASETGITGFAFYLLFIIAFFRQIKETKEWLLMTSFVGFVASNFFLVAHYFPVAYLYLAAMLGYSTYIRDHGQTSSH